MHIIGRADAVPTTNTEPPTLRTEQRVGKCTLGHFEGGPALVGLSSLLVPKASVPAWAAQNE